MDTSTQFSQQSNTNHAKNKTKATRSLDKNWSVMAKATDSIIKLRISPEMLNRLEEHAQYNGRTTNNEILVIIREALISSV